MFSSTIQGLHSRLNIPREGGITYDDFDNKKIVLISDEAHHINAETKKGNEPYSEEVISWEGTVNRILTAGKDIFYWSSPLLLIFPFLKLKKIQ
ncbi:MAG: hypothetical protein WDO71_03050 [Bacteroidota bacterium]